MLYEIVSKLREEDLIIEEDAEVVGLSGIRHRFNLLIKRHSKSVGVVFVNDLNFNKIAKLLAIRLDTNIPIITYCLDDNIDGEVIDTLKKIKGIELVADKNNLIDSIKKFITYVE